jgi:hypothetical protein
MSKKAQAGSKPAERRASASTTDDAEITYHKAPSFLWFAVPLAVLVAYEYFTR